MVISYKTVKMNLFPSTVAKIARLTLRMGMRNRADVVGRAVEVLDLLVSAVDDGKNIYLGKDGALEKVIIPGLTD